MPTASWNYTGRCTNSGDQQVRTDPKARPTWSVETYSGPLPPPGHSINDGIDKDLCSLVYVTVDIAIEQITKLGQDSRLAKIDIQHAYHIIPIHPQDRPLIGMQFEGRVFLDTTLPFGLRSAPKIFTAVADALEWVLRDQGERWIMHYLDDYLTIGSPESEECQHNMAVMSECCRRLGVPLKLEKIEGPTSCLSSWGLLWTHAGWKRKCRKQEWRH